jgi:hypothetical protein
MGMLVKLLQRKNALLPIDVTDEGMVILVKLLHESNASVPIDVTDEGIT